MRYLFAAWLALPSFASALSDESAQLRAEAMDAVARMRVTAAQMVPAPGFQTVSYAAHPAHHSACAQNATDRRYYCGQGDCGVNRTDGRVYCSRFLYGGAGVNAKNGKVYCAKGRCAAGRDGAVLCSGTPAGGALADASGQVVCGVGPCLRQADGGISCARESGRSVRLNKAGKAECSNGWYHSESHCVPGSYQYCSTVGIAGQNCERGR